MVRTKSGYRMHFGAKMVQGANDVPYKKRTPQQLRDNELRLRLCSMGPEGCPGCLLCGFGQEAAQRMAQGSNLARKER